MSLTNLDNVLTAPPLFSPVEELFAPFGTTVKNVFTQGITPSIIRSGDISGNLNMTQGYMQSDNFVTGVNGWKFDNAGNLEANSIVARGSIFSNSGLIAGWTIEASRISQANAYLSSTGYLSFGNTPPTAYGNNVGMWLGYDTMPRLSLYSDPYNYLQWSGTVLTIKGQNFELDASGNIVSSGGTIGGFTINGNSLYGSTIKTGATVAEGSNGVIMDTDGLRGYSSLLGEVFNLPTDGSEPTFSSGIINNTIFEIQTNAVLRTSETVGDGTAASAGVLINNSGFFAVEPNQLIEEANVRISNTGNAYFSGTVDASTISASDINSSNITGATITGGLLRTATSGQRTEISNTGIQLLTDAMGAEYGDVSTTDYRYGSVTRKYGTGALGYINNATYKVPFYIQAEQTVADMHLYNRSAEPTGPAEIGDLAVVSGNLSLCVTAGTPGVWTTLAMPGAGVPSASPSLSPSLSPSKSPSVSPS